MYKKHSICAVIPAYNEEKQISGVLKSIPRYVDKVVVINDGSTDNTAHIVRQFCKKDKKYFLIEHDKNQGVGAARASGYIYARDHDFDIAVFMDGDGQMDPDDIVVLIEPIIKDDLDYVKGNRLFTGEAYKKIPKMRYFGNAMLSLFTKIASGYWHIADSQSGYTAIGKRALHTIPWNEMYKNYGQPNDLLVRLNIYDFKVRDVIIQPIYGVGEKSNLSIPRVTFSISWLLINRFAWRLWQKYVIRDFHPLVFFYLFGLSLIFLSIPLFIRIVCFVFIIHLIPKVNFLAWMFCMIMGFQFVFFAMWFDMERNRDLK
jgi:glycosyltransferase involved in cell wall biosynthesis